MKRKLSALIKESERWAEEYISRERTMRERGAYREAAHYEDLIAAHQGFATALRESIKL